jgi:transcriptional regulator with XRE-family HTH domain
MGGHKLPLGERMKGLRKERGWSQADLAGRIGADGRQISRYENGRITPSLEALAKIAEAFDVSTDYLLFEEASRRPLRVVDNGLAERLGDLGVLAEEDRQSVLRILDALIAKTKVRSLARELEEGAGGG